MTLEQLGKLFDEKFPGVLETKFQVENKEYPIPAVTLFVNDQIKQFWIEEIRELVESVKDKHTEVCLGGVHCHCDAFNQKIQFLLSEGETKV